MVSFLQHIKQAYFFLYFFFILYGFFVAHKTESTIYTH